ncbi:hypothetical protein Tco_0428070 [Tanacetum coccineum]
MVAYLEKTDGNTEFHQIMDFLTRSSIYYALTVSPIVSTLFVEQFWTTAKSRTINNISYIDATVASKPVTISEASIRSDLLFDDADGIDSLNNQAIFDTIQLMSSKSTFWDQILTNITTAVIWKDTPLFDSMLVQQIEDEGEASERPSDSQPIPSPPHPKGSGGNHGGQSSNDASLSENEDGLTLQSVKKLKKGVKPLITHHKAWMKTRLARKTSLKKKGVHKEYVSKQGRKSVKSFKGEPSVHKDPAFDNLDNFIDVDDTLDYMETEDDQNEGRTSSVVLEENESADKELSTEAPISIDKQDGNTDSTKVSTDRQGEVRTRRSSRKRKKGVEIRNIEDTERPRPTSTRSILTLRPLPKIDPKDKGKKRIEEEDESYTESEGITEAEKKFKQLANDEEVARKVQEEREAEEEKKRLAEEEATKVALTNEYDFIQARINTDKILAEELQKEEREKFTIEQRAKFLHDTIAAQRRFLAQQRSEAIRNKPPLRNQLRKQMMTYLKHVGDEKMIKEMNEQAADASKKRVKKDDIVKGEI